MQKGEEKGLRETNLFLNLMLSYNGSLKVWINIRETST